MRVFNASVDYASRKLDVVVQEVSAAPKLEPVEVMYRLTKSGALRGQSFGLEGSPSDACAW